MAEIIQHGVYLTQDQKIISENTPEAAAFDQSISKQNTISAQILNAHHSDLGDSQYHIRFDSLVSHDITYVGIIQTARASGMKEFPIPYALTNCHNSLCAVGGTINEDDHVFGLSAAKKYGGIYVPAHQAVIHQYAREMMAGCGRMILGSDSHTRYGCFGTMGIGEGGPELVKQLLRNTYDINRPEVILVWLEGAPRPGVGPHDIAIELVGAVFKSGFVKNKVLEFAGPGIASLPMDFRAGIDVMTTETACLSSIWETDETVKAFYENHGRAEAFAPLKHKGTAYYDAMIRIDLSRSEAMIALPFHPSNAYTIRELQENPEDILHAVEEEARKQFGKKISPNLRSKIVDGKLRIDQGVIAGCSGGLFDNICAAADILKGKDIGTGVFSLNVYPSSTPIEKALAENGVFSRMLQSGAIMKTAFCGPCFGAGDVPSNNGLSIRHTTRNFPNREGSKPDQGQISFVALMDARSIAATAANQGILTAATDLDTEYQKSDYAFDASIYERRTYNGWGKAEPDAELVFGPNITDWPKFHPLSENILLKLTAVIHDPVTTTDELIPSGETSSYRSNPQKLSEFALSRRVPEYVGRCKEVRASEAERRNGTLSAELSEAYKAFGVTAEDTSFGSVIYANKPGDGSAREQAASCQRVLGGFANIAHEYATKRYRSNCINWGMIPFTVAAAESFDYQEGDLIYIPGIRSAIESGKENIPAKILSNGKIRELTLHCAGLNDKEKEIILDGCLMNFYANHSGD